MIAHILPALLLQLTITLSLRNLAAGTVAACVWSLSREIAQAEYRWIEQYGGGLRANMPWWGGLDYHVWQKLDPWLDWILPSLLAVAIALIVRNYRRNRREAD